MRALLRRSLGGFGARSALVFCCAFGALVTQTGAAEARKAAATAPSDQPPHDADPGASADAEKPSEKALEEAPAEAPAATTPDADGSATQNATSAGSGSSASPTPEPPVQEATSLADNYSEQKNGFRAATRKQTVEWAGGLDLDPGYVRYSFDSVSIAPERYYDVRGRFVVGPTLNHDFDNRWFIKARAEGVLWVRETSTYQINADDVYGQVGQHGSWDFKLGRFQTWRVYHKGLGFDLYTLEDNGACQKGGCDPTSPGVFGPHTYEVSDIYYREPAGHAALHVYPIDWLSLEVAGAYGNTPVLNVLGVRGAAVAHFPFLRLSAAAEYREQYPTKEQTSIDSNGVAKECSKCGGVTTAYGFGGGAELTIAPIEIGVNAARKVGTSYALLSGALDTAASATTTSIGGYAEVDPGTLAFRRPLIVGFGLNRTEVLDQIQDFQQHYQGAAYVVYPLGFNDASIKLVLSEATLYTEQASKDPTLPVQATNARMVAGRVRFSYPF